MENKKISFGFSKISKKNEILPRASNGVQKVELIDCLEGQSIKIKDAPKKEEKKPLVIPLKDSSKNLLDRVREAKERRLKSEIKTEVEDPPDSELTIDQLAARELIRDAQKLGGIQTESKVLSLPLSEDKLINEGKAESTLEDYENIPVSDYGMAMLHGMGWKEGMSIGKKTSKVAVPVVPELRPKGLGLGATKLIKTDIPKVAVDKDGKELKLVKGAFAKIIAGSHRGEYCQVQGLDDENCRIIVKTGLTHNILSLNEFLLVPVPEKEYALGSKVLNNAKYEQYKERSDEKLRKIKSERRNSDSDEPKDKHKSSDSDEQKRRSRNKTKESKHKHKSRHRSRSKSKDSSRRKSKKSKEKKNRSRHSSSEDSDGGHRRHRR